MSDTGPEFEIQEGDGKPVVFIHGWLGSNESWKLVRQYLGLENPKIFYDQSKLTASKFSMDDLADKLHEIIQKLELEKPIIVGHSLGGMTALTYASKYDNLAGLVLLGTSASTPEPEIETFDFYLENLDSMARDDWAEKISSNYAGHLEDGMLKQTAKKELVDASDAELRYPLEAMKRFDVREELGDWNKPALVVAGEKDGAITPEKCREVAELVDAELVELDCGHLMLWESPEKIASLIQKFVETEVK